MHSSGSPELELTTVGRKARDATPGQKAVDDKIRISKIRQMREYSTLSPAEKQKRERVLEENLKVKHLDNNIKKLFFRVLV